MPLIAGDSKTNMKTGREPLRKRPVGRIILKWILEKWVVSV
jgi:hypothetical protein